MARILCTADEHGCERCVRKLIKAAKAYWADCLILGGDITGNVLVPFVESPGGWYEAAMFGKNESFGRDRVEEVRRSLQDAGQYSFVTTPAELEEIRSDKAREEEVFDRAMVGVLESWIQLAQERLKGTRVTCYVSPGNDDKPEIDSALADSGRFVNPENRLVELEGGYEMITLGYANPTPWNSPREVSEEKLGEMVESLAAQVKNPANAVYNLHVPPIDTELDKAPAVSHDFKYV